MKIHHLGRENLQLLLQESQIQMLIYHHCRENLQETQRHFRNHQPPWAEPDLQPPSLSAPDLYHQPSPSLKFTFLPLSLFVFGCFVILLFSFTLFMTSCTLSVLSVK